MNADTEAAEDETKSFLVCGSTFNVPKHYKLVKPVGNGAYGVVCSALNTFTDETVALKKISNVFTNPIETKRTIREIRLLRHFHHENIIMIKDVIGARNKSRFEDVYIVNELMDTDLHQIVVSPQPLTDDHIQYFIYQILRGLLYIHSAGVIHRDLKPSNILLNSNCDLKICDFGLARVASREDDQQAFLTEYVATRWYRAPEIMLSWREYTKAVDVWSVGCILAELLGRKPLFPGRDYMHQLHLILNLLGTPDRQNSEYIASEKAKSYIRSLERRPKRPMQEVFPNAPKDAIDLLEKMLAFAPERRITVEEALLHPYLSLLHDPDDEPVADFKVDFSFEEQTLNKHHLKDILFEEVQHFRQLNAAHYTSSVPPHSSSSHPPAPAPPPSADPMEM